MLVFVKVFFLPPFLRVRSVSSGSPGNCVKLFLAKNGRRISEGKKCVTEMVFRFYLHTISPMPAMRCLRWQIEKL